MPVAEIMTKKLISVSPNETVRKMQELFNKFPIHHILVIDEGKLVGVIDDRSILKIISPYINTKFETEKDLLTVTRQAHQLMKINPTTILPTASIQEAARCLINNNVDLLPVVDNGNKAIGVLSWKDVMRFIMN